MITDFVIGIGHTIYVWVVGVLPEMPEQPPFIAYLFELFLNLNWWLPIWEILQFMPVMAGVLTALAGWRMVRLLLPGG